MKADIKLSTKFATTQNAHQVGLLTTIEGETPVNRTPINLALVLDRSGSMAGEKLAAAKEAAIRFAGHLGVHDRLSVVVFDDAVHTIFGPATPDALLAEEAIARVYEGGSTNLSGGWLQGRTHVEAGLLPDGVNRVVLFTDGQANVGIVDRGPLVELARSAAERRVTTTCIGFGADFNEDLLKAMSDAGSGNFWYVESVDQMASVFAEEIEGLVALAAQNVEVQVVLDHPQVHGVSFLQRYPVQRPEEGTFVIRLGDLYATSPRHLGILFHVEDVGTLGETAIGRIRITADVVRATGVEHSTILMPVVANLDGTNHVEPVVERTFLRFTAAQARDEAVQRADAGDYEGAALLLHKASEALAPYAMDPQLAEESEDLAEEARRMRAREYDRADRKYHLARSMSVRDHKQAYMDKISRRRRPQPGPGRPDHS
jgi:Ca-activated chloride channel family protein